LLRGDRLVFAMFPCVGRLSKTISLQVKRHRYTARTAFRRAGSLAAMGRTVFLSPFDSSSIAGVTRQTCLRSVFIDKRVSDTLKSAVDSAVQEELLKQQ
jgi:hypothetical protein